MSINLNKGSGAGSDSENKNSENEGKLGHDVPKFNFSKSPVRKEPFPIAESENPKIDSSKINFEKAPIKKENTVADKSTSKLDSSKINYEKTPLDPVGAVTTNTNEVKVNNPQDIGSNVRKQSTNKAWMVLVAFAIIGVGIWYFMSTANQDDSLTESANQNQANPSNTANSDAESNVSPVVTTGSSGNESMPIPSNESALGTSSASPTNTELGPQSQQMAVSSREVSNRSSKQNNSTVEGKPANSNNSVSNQSRPGNSNPSITSASNSNEMNSVNKNSKGQSIVGKTANKKSNISKPNNSIGNIPVAQFGFGSTDPVQYEDDLIQQIIIKMNADKNTKLQVNGYASSEGPLDLNVRLSQERADKFREMLIGMGVLQERIVAIGRGIDNPIGDNEKPEGRKMNRRIELEFQ